MTMVAPGAHRASLARIGAFNTLWTAKWEEIQHVEIIPGFTMDADAIELPADWVSTKRQRKKGYRTLNLRSALTVALDHDTVRAEHLFRRIKRIAAILLVTPIAFETTIRQPSAPQTWIEDCRILLRTVVWIVLHKGISREPSSCPDGHSIFRSLSRNDLNQMRQAEGLAGFFSHTAPKLAALARMGVIDDWPDLDLGAKGEPRRRDAALPATAFAAKIRWQPFPDDFVALIGKTSVWLIEELGPSLLDSLETILAVPSQRQDGAPLSNVALNHRRCAALRQWTADNFQRPQHLPIKFRVTTRAQSGATFLLNSWPPPAWRALRRMAMHLQTAHLVIVALATAARDSELMHLQRDCLRTVSSQDLLLGHTFKLSDQPDGEARNWPLPRIAVSAIRQQQRLADILSPGRRSLWLSFKSHDGSDQFPDLAVFGYVLQSFVKGVIVDGQALNDWSDGNVHPHRFRKTVARLAALSMVGATPILFDILGHRDPEMTLNYILSDPGLQDEIRKIASEANIVLSQEVIERSSENGGWAAPLVQDLRLRVAARSGEVELGVDVLAEAAEILSMNGQVTMVKPGVLCTKSLGQHGPCTKKAGLPDVGNCSTDCQHRLEHAAAIDDCIKAIERILIEMPPPENTMMRGWWQTQLAGQLQRFPQIRQRYLAEERVQIALAGMDAATMNNLTSALK